MLGSTVFYSGLVMAGAGLLLALTPLRARVRTTRGRGLMLSGLGVLLAVAALLAPATESKVAVAETRLDGLTPVWQFREHHAIRIAADPARVYEAIKQVSADEIFLFQALTWIRRGGRPLPESIMDAPAGRPIIEVATRGGFVLLADDTPRELVVGAVVVAPPGARVKPTLETFTSELPPGVAVATMNFLVTADGPDRSLVSTETRVFASSDDARRRFAAYWRVIYPGSATIRRQWLRAIARRAEAADGTDGRPQMAQMTQTETRGRKTFP